MASSLSDICCKVIRLELLTGSFCLSSLFFKRKYPPRCFSVTCHNSFSQRKASTPLNRWHFSIFCFSYQPYMCFYFYLLVWFGAIIWSQQFCFLVSLLDMKRVLVHKFFKTTSLNPVHNNTNKFEEFITTAFMFYFPKLLLPFLPSQVV